MPVDPFAADLWALACCLYCFVFGRLPFVGSCVVSPPHLHALADTARHSRFCSRCAAVLDTAVPPEVRASLTPAAGAVPPWPPVWRSLVTFSHDERRAVAPALALRWTSTAPS